MTQHEIPILNNYTFYHELSAENARKSMTKLFAKKPYPDGIFAANDVTALEVLHFAKEIGVEVPSELKIVGYSNDPRSAIVSPSLTTIEQFPAQTGKVIVTELTKMLKHNVNGKQPAEFPEITTGVGLIRRMST